MWKFNIKNWTLAEIKKMDNKIKILITCHRMHHFRAYTEILYIKWDNGRRGLVQLELTEKNNHCSI